MSGDPTSRPVVCFAKHDAGLRSLRRLVALGADIKALLVAESESDRPWYEEMRRLCEGGGIEFLPVRRLSRQPELWEKIREIKPVVGFTMLFTQVIPAEVVKMFHTGIINFHPSLLPKYRGPHPVNWAIINGEKEHGVTAHFVTDTIDGGPIIMQNSFPIGERDTNVSLQSVIDDTIEQQVNGTFEMFRKGVLKAVPQDDSHATYFPARTLEDGRLNFTAMTARQICDMVRSLQFPLYGAFFDSEKGRVIVRKASIVQREEHPSGVVIEVRPEGILIRAREGAILLEEIEGVSPSAFKEGMLLS